MLGALSSEVKTRLPGRSYREGMQRGATGLSEVAKAPVSSIMTAHVVSFDAATTVGVATGVMLERGISGAPVMDQDGKPMGMLSKTDLIEAYSSRKDRHQAAAGQCAAGGPEDVKVGDIMVPYLLAVSSTAPISLASALMAYEGVHRLLVLNDSNQMVGIVSALDILRWLAQQRGFSLPRYTQRQRGAKP